MPPPLALGPLSEDEELALPAQFAEAVAISTRAFTALAKTHDLFVRTETAVRLNQTGSSRTFSVGDKVKIRDGAFANMEGEVKLITEVKETGETPKVTVVVTVFGRPVDVTVDYWHVDKV